jgi:hypothetical protein
MNRKARSSGSLKAPRPDPERGRRHAKNPCVINPKWHQLTIVFNKLHKTANL